MRHYDAFSRARGASHMSCLSFPFDFSSGVGGASQEQGAAVSNFCSVLIDTAVHFCHNRIGLSDEVAYDCISELAKRFSGHPCIPMERLLLPEHHPAVIRGYQDVASRSPDERESPGKGSRERKAQAGDDAANKQRKVPKWIGQHVDLFGNAGEEWWASSPVTDELRALFPGLNKLSPREQDILLLRKVAVPEQVCRLIDVSQSISRTRPRENVSGCATPGMKVYISDRCRLVMGLESLNLQGIHYGADHVKLAHYTDTFLLDLAGNAFHTGTCGA